MGCDKNIALGGVEANAEHKPLARNLYVKYTSITSDNIFFISIILEHFPLEAIYIYTENIT